MEQQVCLGRLWGSRGQGAVGWSVCTHRLLAAAWPPSALSASLDTFYYPRSDGSRMSDPPTATLCLSKGGFAVPPEQAEATCRQRVGRLRQEHPPLSHALCHPLASPNLSSLSYILGKGKCFRSIILSFSRSVFRALIP